MNHRLLQSTQEGMGGQKRSTVSAAGRSSTRGQQHPEAVSQLGEAPSNYSKPTVFPWECTDWITLINEKNTSSWGLFHLRTAYKDHATRYNFKPRF